MRSFTASSATSGWIPAPSAEPITAPSAEPIATLAAEPIATLAAEPIATLAAEPIATLAAEPILRRRLRTSLADFARLSLAAEGRAPARHHLALIAALEDVAAGDCDRLMVLMPPGSAKSTYASVLFPPWWLARHPASDVIAASHTAELATHFGRRAREQVLAHGGRLGLALMADQRAAGRWETRGGGAANALGRYFATGVRGPVVGRRADLVLIDDPVKSQAEADSAAQRDAVWDWYRSDLLTRLKPGGRVVLVMTRWHEDDLGGRLLALQGDEWRCLRLPALAEPGDPLGRAEGEALWPDWEDRPALLRKREALGARAFAALFQQSPRPPQGAFFHPERIGLLAAAPETVSGRPPGNRVVRAWDLAATPKRADNNPDWTVGLKLLRDEAGRFIVLDIVRLRGSPLQVEQALLATARADGDVFQCFPRDPGQAGVFQQGHIGRLLAGFGFGFSPERGAKAIRAAPVAAQMEAGNLAMVRADWNAAFIDELRSFPDGTHDDQADALSRAFTWLAAAPPPAAPRPVPVAGWMGR